MSIAIFIATVFLGVAFMNNSRFVERKKAIAAKPQDPGRARTAEQYRLTQLKTALLDRAIALIERDHEAIQASMHRWAAQQAAHLPFSRAQTYVIERHFRGVALIDDEFMRLQAERRLLWARGCWMADQSQGDWWAQDVGKEVTAKAVAGRI